MSRDDVATIDNWLEQIGARWGVNERTMFGARLCIAELAANTLEHGVAISGEDHTIVTARRRPFGIELEFLDSRAPFDPTAKPARLREGLLNLRMPEVAGFLLFILMPTSSRTRMTAPIIALG